MSSGIGKYKKSLNLRSPSNLGHIGEICSDSITADNFTVFNNTQPAIYYTATSLV